MTLDDDPAVPPGAALIGWLALGERPSGLEAAAVAIVAGTTPVPSGVGRPWFAQ